MKCKYQMTKEDNIFFTKRKLIDNLYKSTSLIPKLPSECNYEDELNKIKAIEKPLERCITLFCWIQRSQMFKDGNKRVANLIANKEMIRLGMGILSIQVEKNVEYLNLLIRFYETNNYEDISNWIYDNCIDGI